MTSASNALMKAVHARLTGDAALTALVGQGGVHDRLMPKSKLPAIAFGEWETRDYSTGTEPGEAHSLTITVWSQAEGRRQAQEIASRVDTLLHDAALTLEGFVLVSLLRTGSRTRREPNTRYLQVELRYRAVTE
ncbi:hypothetical protein ASG19_01675 [Rhizobium sp. Leaf306]|jgi:hypothetical protein|uniref:DUF3168 domain-containing protein n=1 Tax=Rhizobium sp. Leaf306 TaxID=1736330 RepID=UPI000715C999|nr:DUF3168 domain-containing protein [Rhizobium sp. Leaf306]KQQ37837.1 hypothetical protein ASG19_01675 [Rhizobium sp. Leaf306]